MEKSPITNYKSQKGYFALVGLIAVVAIILVLNVLYFIPGNKEQAKNIKGSGISERSDTQDKQVSVIQVAQAARFKVMLVEIRSAILIFEAMEERKPMSLDELKGRSDHVLRDLPKGYVYDYDPETGSVVIKKGNEIAGE